MQVRERIRINGQPVSPELFTKHFWRLYHRLEETKVRTQEGCGRAGEGALERPQRVLGVPEPHLPGAEAAGPWALTCSCPQDSSSCVSMPAYFRFLTLMAFHIFLQEKVRARSPKSYVRGLGERNLSRLGVWDP